MTTLRLRRRSLTLCVLLVVAALCVGLSGVDRADGAHSAVVVVGPTAPHLKTNAGWQDHLSYSQYCSKSFHAVASPYDFYASPGSLQFSLTPMYYLWRRNYNGNYTCGSGPQVGTPYTAGWFGNRGSGNGAFNWYDWRPS